MLQNTTVAFEAFILPNDLIKQNISSLQPAHIVPINAQKEPSHSASVGTIWGFGSVAVTLVGPSCFSFAALENIFVLIQKSGLFLFPPSDNYYQKSQSYCTSSSDVLCVSQQIKMETRFCLPSTEKNAEVAFFFISFFTSGFCCPQQETFGRTWCKFCSTGKWILFFCFRSKEPFVCCCNAEQMQNRWNSLLLPLYTKLLQDRSHINTPRQTSPTVTAPHRSV